MFRSFAMDAVLDDVRTTGQSAYSKNADGPVERVSAEQGLNPADLHAELAAFDRAQDSGTLADLAAYIGAAIRTVARSASPDIAQCDHMNSLLADVERVSALRAYGLTLNDL